jgi:hypothetical protein
MDESELAECYAVLGVAPGADRDALTQALMQKNFALIRAGAPGAEREQLRAAHDAILAYHGAIEAQEQATARAEGRETLQEKQAERALTEAEKEFEEPKLSPWDPRSFDSRFINLLAPPLVALLAIFVQQTPFAFFLQGFHVWIHEFGHATIGWMTGHRALPLPIGWTPIAADKSLFVYFGVLFLLGVLFVASVRERKVWPALLAVGLALLQAAMTWRLPETTAQLWISFCGVSGEFYLSAAMVGLFFFQFPEKFRWGACRYFFLFIGSGSFFQTFMLWRKIYRGEEGIPYGSMINGEADAGGDMNALHDEFGWTQHDIIFTYHHLGNACLTVMIGLWVFFGLRLDQMVARVLGR